MFITGNICVTFFYDNENDVTKDKLEENIKEPKVALTEKAEEKKDLQIGICTLKD